MRSVVQLLAASPRQAWPSVQGPLFLSRLHLAPHDLLYIPTAIKRRIRGGGLTPYYPSLVPDFSADAHPRFGPLKGILPAILRFHVSSLIQAHVFKSRRQQGDPHGSQLRCCPTTLTASRLSTSTSFGVANESHNYLWLHSVGSDAVKHARTSSIFTVLPRGRVEVPRKVRLCSPIVHLEQPIVWPCYSPDHGRQL